MQIDNGNNGSDNSGQASDVGSANNATNDASNVGNDGVDAAFAKHLDIAIEAQDGPAKTTTPEKKDDQAPNADDKSGVTGNDPAPTDNNNKDPSVTDAARTLARAKDLKLPDGTTVRGGAERRFYEQREAARQQLTVEQREHQSTRQQLENITKERDAIKHSVESLHGTDPQTVQLGVTIVRDLQRDPVGTMKKLLAETVAQGYKIEDIGSGVDAAAIQRMIDARLPTNSANDKPSEEQILTDARTEVVTFYNQFPDAQPHDALIARVLQDHPQMTLKDVYFQLKDAFAEKGFDWSRSLQDNMQDASSTNNAGHSQNNDAPTNTPKPLPNGRGGDGGEFKLNTSGSASEDLDTADIVREAMRESGLNI